MIDRLGEFDMEQRFFSPSRTSLAYGDVRKESSHVIRFFSHEIIHEFHVGFFGTESVNEKDDGVRGRGFQASMINVLGKIGQGLKCFRNQG